MIKWYKKRYIDPIVSNFHPVCPHCNKKTSRGSFLRDFKANLFGERFNRMHCDLHPINCQHCGKKIDTAFNYTLSKRGKNFIKFLYTPFAGIFLFLYLVNETTLGVELGLIPKESPNCNYRDIFIEGYAIDLAYKKYGIAASAVNCKFETGTVRKISSTVYKVDVFCGGMNPVTYTLKCSSNGDITESIS